MNVGLLEIVAAWVGKMLRMFGLGEGELNEIGWGEERQGDDNVNVSKLYCVNPFQSDLLIT